MNTQHHLITDTKTEKAARIFRKAMALYEKGNKYQAMQTARYALNLARRTDEYCKVYINGFLAMLKWELGQQHMAIFYCQQALNSLFSYHTDYENDKKYYHSMLKAIEAEAN